MEKNDHASGANEDWAATEPRFSNPLKRRALPGLLTLGLGAAFLWGIVSFCQDAFRVSDNYRKVARPSFVQPTTYITPNMPITTITVPNISGPHISVPQTSIAPVAQPPIFQPAAAPRRIR